VADSHWQRSSALRATDEVHCTRIDAHWHRFAGTRGLHEKPIGTRFAEMTLGGRIHPAPYSNRPFGTDRVRKNRRLRIHPRRGLKTRGRRRIESDDPCPAG